GSAAYKKSEDPLHVLENSIPINTKYCLDNQLAKSLVCTFEPTLEEKAPSLYMEVLLVSGDHARTIQTATLTVGGLVKSALKTRTCLGCRTAPKPTNSVPGQHFSK
ncbi:hypothetical protein BDM02DRAFT_3092466, partial [Thelephora ganbajun]